MLTNCVDNVTIYLLLHNNIMYTLYITQSNIHTHVSISCVYMGSGENVVIMSPDSEILSVLQAAMSSEVRLTIHSLSIHMHMTCV